MEQLNFDLISKDGLAAVHCPTEEGAKFFLRCLKEQYPSKQFRSGATCWDYYYEDTCYWPNFPHAGGLSYGDIDYANEAGYHVYELEDLYLVRDLPLDDYEVNIKSLFGME